MNPKIMNNTTMITLFLFSHLTYNRCDCLLIIPGKCTARVMHDTAILIGTIEQNGTGIPLSKLRVFPWYYVVPIDFHIGIPEKSALSRCLNVKYQKFILTCLVWTAHGRSLEHEASHAQQFPFHD